MSKETAFALDRDTASTINPFIGVNTEDTLNHCERAISDLGYVISVANETGIEVDLKNLFRIFETITFAMRYEAHAQSQLKETSHV